MKKWMWLLLAPYVVTVSTSSTCTQYKKGGKDFFTVICAKEEID